MLISGDATLTGNIEIQPGNNTISVNASGNAALGVWPHMVVKVSGTTVIDTYVNSDTPATFSGTYNNPGSAGPEALTITYDNDYTDDDADRNLRLSTVSVDDGAGNLQGWSVALGAASVQQAQAGNATQGCYTLGRYFGQGALRVLAGSGSYQTINVESARKSFVGPGRLSFKLWIPGNASGKITNLQGYAKNSSNAQIASTSAVNVNSSNAGRWVEASLTLSAGQTAAKVGVTFAEQPNYSPNITEVDRSCTQNSDCQVNSCVSGHCSTSVACSAADLPSGNSVPSLVIDAIQYDYTGP